MVVCCDTSFLFSVYGNDQNTPLALDFLSRSSHVLSVSLLNSFELENAFRLAEYRKLIKPGASSLYFAHYREDVAAQRIVEHPCNLAEVIRRASGLSVAHTAARGHRGLDILQVAAALEMGAGKFLTFDKMQSLLANSVGLTGKEG